MNKDSNIWEFGHCPLCKDFGNFSPVWRFSLTDFEFVLEQDLPKERKRSLWVVKCRVCGLYYLYPRLAEEWAQKIYTSDSYFSGQNNAGYKNYLEQEESLRATFRAFLRSLNKRGLTGVSVADIGCGYGWFLDEARDYFRMRYGTDLCAPIAEAASRYCDGVVVGGPKELESINKDFQLVVSIGVLEHLYNPVKFLMECGNLLKRGGRAVIVTPDVKGLWRRLMGKRWPSFKLPEHISFFDKNTLQYLGKKAGMVLEGWFPYHQAFPLKLILEKLALPVPENASWLCKKVFLPNVMLASVFKPNS